MHVIKSYSILAAMGLGLLIAPPVFAQTPCQAELDVAKRKANAPQDRRIAAQKAAVCFQLQQVVGAGAALPLPAGAPAISQMQDARAGLQAAEDEEADSNSAIDFESKLGFGVGVGYSWGRGRERVDDAEVVNGTVRVKRATTDKPRLFLEAHRFLWTNRTKDWGIGPFVSVQSGSDDALSSWGAGLMFGFRETAQKGDAPTGWNLGLGYLWDADIKQLGDGISANAPLPEGETEIRYTETSSGSLFVVFSRKF